MLSASDLASARAALEESLPDIAIIKNPSWVSDGRGGGTTTFTAAGTVPCRISPLTGDERVEGERISTDSESMVTAPFDAAVESDSVLDIQSRLFAVTSVREPRSWAVSRRIEMKEIT